MLGSRKTSLSLAAAASVAFALFASPASGVTIADSPQPTWQTVGGLDAQKRNLEGRVDAIVYGRRASAGLVFLGGEFTQMQPPSGTGGGPVTRLHLAALSVKTGELMTRWRTQVRSTNGSARVLAMALSADGKVLYVGGRFDSIRGRARSNVAALNARNGRVLRWRPRANRGVHSILVGRGDGRIYLGGTFTEVNGVERQHLAAVRRGRAGALVGGWNVPVAQTSGTTCPPRCAPDVLALALGRRGRVIYLGGSFATVGSRSRNSAAAVVASSGRVTRWNPSVFDASHPGALNTVHSLQPVGKRVYVCGDFWTVNAGRASARVSPHLAAVDSRRGDVIARFNAATDGTVNQCAFRKRAKLLFLGGHFDHAGRRGAVVDGTAPSRQHIAAVGVRRGRLNAWSPSANSVPGVFAVAVRKGHVAVGGDFTTINGSEQAGFAQFALSF
jgi:hypothetical protein